MMNTTPVIETIAELNETNATISGMEGSEGGISEQTITLIIAIAGGALPIVMLIVAYCVFLSMESSRYDMAFPEVSGV
ncbi:unnamed protein product [Nippostrongylus brasiliensis]|uniref:Col_cuticle_N domain-containing protein n=1 Tax=Nippostrongylus brasiliensis TaxID=27835 RepID=A0A0N4XSI9_NIPBR|nr:unnamed protein product [Nippostrongylus brasiliensis]